MSEKVELEVQAGLEEYSDDPPVDAGQDQVATDTVAKTDPQQVVDVAATTEPVAEAAEPQADAAQTEADAAAPGVEAIATDEAAEPQDEAAGPVEDVASGPVEDTVPNPVEDVAEPAVPQAPQPDVQQPVAESVPAKSAVPPVAASTEVTEVAGGATAQPAPIVAQAYGTQGSQLPASGDAGEPQAQELAAADVPTAAAPDGRVPSLDETVPQVLPVAEVPQAVTPVPVAPVPVAPVPVAPVPVAPVPVAPVPVAKVPPVPLPAATRPPAPPEPADVTMTIPVAFDPPAPTPVHHLTSVTTDVPVEPRDSGRRNKSVLAATLTSVVVAVALVVGCVAVGASFFSTHAKPGTEVAGRNVTGFSQAQISGVTRTLIESYTATLSFEGKETTATAQELGITFDADRTVAQALAAGNDRGLGAYNPFATKNVPLVMTIDQTTLQDYLNKAFIASSARSVPAGVRYDPAQGDFVVVPGQKGVQADASAVGKALMEGAGFGSTLTVPTTEELPAITDDVAHQAAGVATQRMVAAPYTITAGRRSMDLTADNIGAWTTFTQDVKAGTITPGIDAAKVGTELPAIMNAALADAPVNQEELIGPNGTPVGIMEWGEKGSQVADPATVSAQVADALLAGQGAQLSVGIVTKDFEVVQVPMDAEYQVPNGEKWVEVNRSDCTVTRWEGTTALSTWSVVIGRAATPTYLGVYHVQYKIAVQTMKGVDYTQPDVPWIAYFNGDIALHGNYWTGGFGFPASHGCVGMPVSLAKEMYDWIEDGTLVVVHD